MSLPLITDTISLNNAVNSRWDVIVIGAGIAGASAAAGLASKGCRALLVDRSSFPRHKVCGGCLNAAALSSMAQLGIADPAISMDAPLTRSLKIYCGKRSPKMNLVPGRGVSRESLDVHLVDHACRSGADLLQGVTATVGQSSDRSRQVELRSRSGTVTLEAGLVLVADGLNGRSLATTNCAGVEVSNSSYIGVSSILESHDCQADLQTIHMSVGREGYFGIVQVEHGKWSVAAAINPMFVKSSGGASQAITKIAREAGFSEMGEIDTVTWRGTPQLSRRRPTIAANRMLVLGDAAGYVEPFTGEGMSWSFAAALAIQAVSESTGEHWDATIERWWKKTYRRNIARRQRVCRVTKHVLRKPWLASSLACAMITMPRSSGYLIRRVGRPKVKINKSYSKPWSVA
ncbi:MAG: FAD-dependent monooxygenase [Phycisphaerales bacterium]|nr:FAD-dependent monooxygenase [Phycisphaerales bacterium]